MSKKEKPEKKPADEALATLMLDRQERAMRCKKAIDEICEKERVTISVLGFDIIDGRVVGKIQLVPLD